MKVALSFLIFCGVMLSVDGCLLSTCGSTPTGVLTGTEGCTNYQTFLDCLTTEKAKCSAGDAQLALITSAETTYKAARDVLKCGAAEMAVSVVALLLPIIAAFTKL